MISGLKQCGQAAEKDNVCLLITLGSKTDMLHYAVVFLVIALIAAVLGFGGFAAGAAGIAKILFVVFLIGAIVSFLMHSGRRV